MLTPWDDFPIHQTSYPIAHPVSSDSGRYDRHWLALHDTDMTTQVGIGLSVHPNRGLVDGSISVVRDGRQHSVHASGPLSRARDTRVGPLRIEVIEPMRSLRVVLEPTDGMAADLTWHAVTQAVEDGHMERRSGTTLISERTRMVQFGEWSGELVVGGDQVKVHRDSWWGFRDRSWGTRSTGTVAEASMAPALSNIYFAWTLLRFDDECLLVAVNETSTGISEARTVASLPFITGDEPSYGEEEKVTRSDSFTFDIGYEPGTRRPSAVHLAVGPRGGIHRDIRLRPELTFQMKGLGYGHPRWRHGTDHGGLAVGHESWSLDNCDPALAENRHVQQLVTAQRSDGATGRGLFEHVAVGPHVPTGLT